MIEFAEREREGGREKEIPRVKKRVRESEKVNLFCVFSLLYLDWREPLERYALIKKLTKRTKYEAYITRPLVMILCLT